MITEQRPYDGRDDGAEPLPGEVSWSQPFDLVLRFHQLDMNGADASTTLANLEPGDQIGYEASTFSVAEVTPAGYGYAVAVELHDPPTTTEPSLLTFTRWGEPQPEPPQPEPEPEPEPIPVGRRPWRAEVSIR